MFYLLCAFVYKCNVLKEKHYTCLTLYHSYTYTIKIVNVQYSRIYRASSEDAYVRENDIKSGCRTS